MRVFVCEFVTGGGLAGKPLPPSLAREGAMMRDALIADLAALGCSIWTAHDARLPAPEKCASRPVHSRDEAWTCWRNLAEAAELAWPIAPETDGALERLTSLMLEAGARAIGPDLPTLRICASKTATAERLIEAGVSALQAYALDALPRDLAGPIVTKPDDGAGCCDTRLWPDPSAIGALPGHFVAQAYLPGEPISLTILCDGGRGRLLTVNRQRVAIEEGVFRFHGVTVAALPVGRAMTDLAAAVCAALPGLAGIVGVDAVLTPSGPVVVEVNPRLTTSYVGLGAALRRNPLTLLPEFGWREDLDLVPDPAARAVEVLV